MMTVHRSLTSLIILLALAGVTVSGVEAVTMMPDQPAAMAAGAMTGDGMRDCDGCGGDVGSLAGCMMICGLSCAGDLGQVPGSPTGQFMIVGGAIGPGFVLPPGMALSREPPKPKPHSL